MIMHPIVIDSDSHVISEMYQIWVDNHPEKIKVLMEIDGQEKILEGTLSVETEEDWFSGWYFEFSYEQGGEMKEGIIHSPDALRSWLGIEYKNFVKRLPEKITVYNNLHGENNILHLCENGVEYKSIRHEYDTYSIMNAFLCNVWYKLNKRIKK